MTAAERLAGTTLEGGKRTNYHYPWEQWLDTLEREGKLFLRADIDYPWVFDKVESVSKLIKKYGKVRFKRDISTEVARDCSTINVTFRQPKA